MKKVRARAPLRLGIAGGGTDLSPYCDDFGGCVLNYTIGVYAYAVIEERADWLVVFSADDIEKKDEVAPQPFLPPHEGLSLHRAVYNRIVRDFNAGRPLSISVYTAVDAPPGSGLGSSSALIVALVKAFSEFLRLPLGDYDIARLAYEIERVDLAMAGGRQDQYAAAFGGCNFIEFLPNDRVVVNPLRIHEEYRLELETSLVVCHTGRSRVSSEIIENQIAGMQQASSKSVEAMHQIKRDAQDMKVCLLSGNIQGMAEVLERSWNAKKLTAASITNSRIDEIYDQARAAGATAGKISGAGGGGYMMLLTRPERRQTLVRRLKELDLPVLTCHFTEKGAESWHSAM
ncbi:GHMP kinase [Microvirga sp. HBU67558]|uniref:GHMP family kinase ATP-binding protein n=1 Tax=Microvirga TaxID=186650 RepID=UPI001B370F95|nr:MULTISPECIES: GHMP kinase [unclassified Microvirga]MBQ0820534.1 GHMP kinase [Microvirga sp. HBU67558]